MKKLIILAIPAILAITIVLTGCDKTPQEFEEQFTVDSGQSSEKTTGSTSDKTKKPKATSAETNEPPPELPDDDEIVVDDGEDNANLEVPVNTDANNYTERREPQYFKHGWVPQVMLSRVPKGTPDYVEKVKKHIDYDRMTFFIGVSDLLDPENGYKHIDHSGKLHPSSVIKLWIAEYAYLEIEKGNAKLSQSIGNGSTMGYYISEMMGMSCNESTAHIISYFGRAKIDKWMQENYKSTRLHSDLRGNYSDGLANCTSVSDTIAILEKIYHNRTREPYAALLNQMFNARTRAKLPAAMAKYPEVKVATKTGSFIYYSAADHDVGIIIGYDKNGKIETAMAIALYSFSLAHKPTFSTARPILYKIARDVYEGFKEQSKKSTVTTTAPTTTTKPKTTTTKPKTTTTKPKTTTKPPTKTTPPLTTSTPPPTTVPITQPPALE